MVKYVKTTFFIALTFMAFGCSSDDDSIDSSLLLNEFTEPYLGFCVSQEELLDNIGVPDNIEPGGGALFIFNNPYNGVKQIRYRMSEFYSSDIDLYANSNVEFYHNQQNFDFILNWLTNKYGTPEPRSIETHLDSYVWYYLDVEFNIVLNISNENLSDTGTPRIFLAYYSHCL